MINMDKILKYVAPQIINTINLLVKENNRPQLEKWLADCKKEIEFRGPHNCYELQLEKTYLETILS